ncbi:TRAP transporter substrate-binding protein [Hydrogenophaga taeniospiralis]|uniref:TRAP transporter substrate-binding protein n=1 Tax=Hydrogenophaga taeniospiralis TaxID=65656 RepID=UPI001CFB62FB|nr:TRAP transporter substrate-binding protein [Hydrogenophaga taeniospiralis]MCB4363638.1 TRAP transporter substrate-binding protein [Hydrogenophaga taeniospiralis]
MNKRNFIAGAALALATLAAAPAMAQEVKARMGHVFAANSPMDQAAQEFAKLVGERTKGKIAITIFPASQLGGEMAQARELSRGSLEMALLNPGSLAGLNPLLDIHYLPYIATDFKAVDAIFYNPKGVLQTTLRETLNKQGIETLGFFELEFRAVTNSSRPVEKPADLKGLKLRVPGSAAIKTFFEDAGTQVVVMPFPELFTALQQKTVDGQDNGASITYESRLFETQKYMTLTNHVYAMGTVASSSKFWSKLSDADKKVLTDTAAEVTKKQIKKNRQMNAEFLQKIESGGIKLIRPSAQAMAEFEKVGQGVWEKLSTTYGADRIAALRQEAAAARK